MGLRSTCNRLIVLSIFISSPAMGAAIKGLDEGSQVAYCKQIDFVGSNVALTASGLNCTLTESVAGGANTVYDDLGDPDANSDIDFTGFTNIWTSTQGQGTTFFTIDGGDLQVNSLINIDGTTCLDVSSDEIYHDTDCDGVKDAGEEFIDQASGSGDTAQKIIDFKVQSAKLTGSFVTDGDATEGADLNSGDGNWRLLFDATTDEGAVWQFRVPNNYSSTPVLNVGYTMASATSGTVEFEDAIMCVSDGDAADVGTASFSTIATSSATVPGTAGHLDVLSITLNDDSCAANDLSFIYLSTDADDGTNDTASGDREVVFVTLSYTSS